MHKKMQSLRLASIILVAIIYNSDKRDIPTSDMSKLLDSYTPRLPHREAAGPIYRIAVFFRRF